MPKDVVVNSHAVHPFHASGANLAASERTWGARPPLKGSNTCFLLLRSCVPWSCAFLSLLLKFFHQLARSFFSFTDSLWAACGNGLGPPAPAEAVEGPLLAMPGDVAVAVATTGYGMRKVRSKCGDAMRRGHDECESWSDAARACSVAV